MEFGALYDLRNPPQWRTRTDRLYAETLDHVAAIEAMGLDAVWVTEHHFIDDEYLPSCLPFAAAIATRTQRVVIGTAVLLLPLHDPLRVAEDAAVVDQISGGRFRLGLGLGYKVEEFETFGVSRASRPRRLEEGIEVLRGAWGDGPFTFEGRWYQYRELDVTPKPAQRPGPEIWLAGRTEVPVRRAARIGDGSIVTDPSLAPLYHQACAESGRPANLCTFAFSYPTHDPERASATLGEYARYRLDRYVDWYGTAGDLPVDIAIQEAVAAGTAPMAAWESFKTPEAVIAELKALEALGVTSLLFFAGVPGAPMEATLPLFQTLADEVMPAFR
jgi:alkanesulfonate monooxygenase SsuD/methylene tetrahydromethanopterin reductase-like flavin-dependent oxidoreductase (luciferase family)